MYVLPLPVTTDVQNPRVRYVGANLNLSLTCDFAEGSTAEGCYFNFTGVTTQQSFFVNRSKNSSEAYASSCHMANAVADNTDFVWSAFDDIGGVSIPVNLTEVDEDDFKCAGVFKYFAEAKTSL